MMGHVYCADEFKQHILPKRKGASLPKETLLTTITDGKLESLRSALTYLSGTLVSSTEISTGGNETYSTNYSEWIKTGINLKTLGPIGYELWDEFSKPFVDYDPAQVAEKWGTFTDPDTDYLSVLRKAKFHGWSEQTPYEDSDKIDLEDSVFHISDLDGKPVPKQKYLMQGFIPIGAPTGLYANGGVGKSLFAQMLMTCVASGNEIFGLELKHGSVVGLFCENSPDHLHMRQDPINQHYGLAYRNLENIHYFPRQGFDNALLTNDPIKRELVLTYFWEALYKYMEKVKPVLLVVDTIADTFGGNEIDRNQTRQYVQRALGRLAMDFNCAVLALGHVAKGTKDHESEYSGSTSWNNSFRARLLMTRNDYSVVNLSVKKANDGETGQSINMVWKNGVLVATKNTSVKDNVEWGYLIKDTLDLVGQFNRRKSNISMSKKGNYAPREFSRTGGSKWSLKQYESALDELLNTGEIKIVKGNGNSSGNTIVRFD